MFRFAFRFTKAFVIFAIILTVSVAAGVAYYVAQGGDLSRLEKEAVRTLSQTREFTDPKSLLEKGKELSKNAADLLAAEKAKSAASAPSKPLAPPSEGEIQVYFAPCDAAEPFGIDDAFLGLLRRATQSIRGAFFELELPAAAETLIAKHREGVEVRIVSDSDYQSREAVQACIAAGIPVAFDNREAFMHDKFCVVDDTFVWTGSTNITENCMYKNDNNSLLFRSMRLAQDYGSEFDEMFNLHSFGKKSQHKTPYPSVMVGNVNVECYFAPEDEVEKAVVERIGAAQSRIDVMAFSFTSTAVAKAIASRIGKGAKVRAVFDERQAGSKYSQDRFLAEHGATVRLDTNPYAMHNKVIIIDDGMVITGSYNFTKSASTENDENLLVVHSPDIAAQYERKFESIFGAN